VPSGRTRQFDVDEALAVFWARGYEGATLPELTRAMRINRPSLSVGYFSRSAMHGAHRVKTVFPCVRPSHIARNPSSARSIGRTTPISGSIPA
jgi:hypothetical protein